MLESYDEDLEAYDYEVFEPSDDANGLEELMYEFSVHEPVKNFNVLMLLLMKSRSNV